MDESTRDRHAGTNLRHMIDLGRPVEEGKTIGVEAGLVIAWERNWLTAGISHAADMVHNSQGWDDQSLRQTPRTRQKALRPVLDYGLRPVFPCRASLLRSLRCPFGHTCIVMPLCTITFRITVI